MPESARTSLSDTMYPPATPVTSPSTMALTPSRSAIWRASAESMRADGGCFMNASAAVTEAGETSVNAEEPDKPARTASLTTRPSVESTLLVRKSVRMMGSRALSFPAARSEPKGPTPKARIVMNTAMSVTKTPSAHAPPRAVRFQLTLGAAFSAMVAIVPCAAVLGVPPGVNVGVAVIARRVTRCTYPVQSTTGRPSAITTSEPGNTHSGRPMPTIAALASTATATNAAA